MQAPSQEIVIIGAGQSGLAAARAVRDAGLQPLVLEAAGSPAGSWPDYYDSLTLFSPADYSAMPGLPFPGDPDHYPHRDVFAELDGDQVVWADGTRERVDTVLLATGYLPSLDYLRELGALDDAGLPLHSGGISITHPGLVYLGLEFQRSFASNTLRGVARDAEYVIVPLAAYVRDAPATIGL